MESIKGGDIKKPAIGVGAAIITSVEAPKAEAPRDATSAKATDSVGRSDKAPEFKPAAEKMDSEQSAAFGQALTALQKADAPNPPKLAAAQVQVWTNENNFTSNSQVKTVTLPEVQVSASGIRTPFTLVTGLGTVDKLEGQQPFEGNSKVTRDQFDQVQLTACLVGYMDLQAKVGIDNSKVWRAKVNDGICRAKANAVSDLNAFYSPTSNDLSFGTNNGKWHLAADNDVTGHEMGHSLGDKQNPNMFSGEGGAIHEGYFGDLRCALVNRNANLSEDFGTALGTPGEPLRNLSNDKTLRQAGSEVHDRGEAYGGFGWRITEKLAQRTGSLDSACDIMLHVALKTGFYLTTKSPTSKDFVDATVRCARDSLPNIVDQATVDFVCEAIKAEGIKREMINSSWSEPSKASTDAKTQALQAELGGKAATCSVSTATAAVEKVFGKRSDCEMTTAAELAWKNPASDLESQKLILQLKAIDPKSGKKYPVEDGYMAMLATGGDVSAFAGNGRRILDQGAAYKFDFTPIANRDQAIAKATAAIEKFIDSQLESHKHLKAALKANMSRFFATDGIEVTDVMYKGKICLSITSAAGQFIYNDTDGSVEAHRLMFIDNFAKKKKAA